VWGVGILALRDEKELGELQEGDPAISASIGMRYEAFPMPTLIVGGLQT